MAVGYSSKASKRLWCGSGGEIVIDLFDGGACRRGARTEIFSSRLEQIDRAGALVEIDVGRQHVRLRSGYRAQSA